MNIVMIIIMIIMLMMIMANRAVCLHPDLEYRLVSSQGSLYIMASAILPQPDAGTSHIFLFYCYFLLQYLLCPVLKILEVYFDLVFAGIHQCFSSGYKVVSSLSGYQTRPLVSDNSDDDSEGSATGPLLPGLHVTSTAGTGLVHTAPQHGQDDFRVGLAHGLVKVGVINTNHSTNELY